MDSLAKICQSTVDQKAVRTRSKTTPKDSVKPQTQFQWDSHGILKSL